MKKLIAMMVVLLLVVGCGQQGGGASNDKAIKIYSRDSSSGTRGAFEELIGLEDGKLTNDFVTAESNGDMATKVGLDEAGIGYVSLTTDFKANKIKPVKFEGVEPSEAATISGEYKLSRPFMFVTRAKGDFESEDKEALVAAFIDFLTNSKEGLEAVASKGGIVDTSKAKPWSELKAAHPIVDKDNSGLTLKTGGSTSVEGALKAGLEAFVPLAGNFKFEMGHTGSGAGHERTLGKDKDSVNKIDIGFASRKFKDSEAVDAALASGTFALDAVVVVVSEKNDAVSDLNAAQLVQIFSGEVKNWKDVK